VAERRISFCGVANPMVELWRVIFHSDVSACTTLLSKVDVFLSILTQFIFVSAAFYCI